MSSGLLEQKKSGWVRSYPPQAPANLRITFISPSVVTFGWERPPMKGNESEDERTLLGYEIFYQVSDSYFPRGTCMIIHGPGASPQPPNPPATLSLSSRPPQGPGPKLGLGRGEAGTNCMRGCAGERHSAAKAAPARCLHQHLLCDSPPACSERAPPRAWALTPSSNRKRLHLLSAQSESPGGGEASPRGVSDPQAHRQVRGLSPGTAVEKISVKARNVSGWGIPSLPPISGRSAAAAPGAVSPCAAASRNRGRLDAPPSTVD